MPAKSWVWQYKFGLALAAVLAFSVACADMEADVRQVWQMLDYVAVDYRGAVTDGSVSNQSE